MPHGHHIYATSSYIYMATMCAYTLSQHALTHCKCVLRCCSNWPHIELTGQESGGNHTDTLPTIWFHIYHLIASCTVYGILPLYEKKLFCSCLQNPDYVPPVKLYTRKELVMIETYITEFYTSFYITEIKKI